jgi:hypothetical protein
VSWQATYSERFLRRVAIQRPARPHPYVRMTDEQIEILPPELRSAARISRNVNDICASFAAAFPRLESR